MLDGCFVKRLYLSKTPNSLTNQVPGNLFASHSSALRFRCHRLQHCLDCHILNHNKHISQCSQIQPGGKDSFSHLCSHCQCSRGVSVLEVRLELIPWCTLFGWLHLLRRLTILGLRGLALLELRCGSHIISLSGIWHGEHVVWTHLAIRSYDRKFQINTYLLIFCGRKHWCGLIGGGSKTVAKII